MAYRPEWDEKRGGGSSLGGLSAWFRGLSGVGLILVLTFGAFVVQLLIAKSQGGDLLGYWFGLRAWWPGEGAIRELADGTVVVERGAGASFNLLFPVQLVSYMFVHSVGSLWHVAGNMLYVFIFGRELEAALGRNGFLRLYFAGGIVGGLACWVAAMIDQSWVPIVGASGAVYALMLLYTLKWPRRTFILFPLPIPIPVWILAAWRIFGDLNGLVTGATGVAFLAHLGGALVGFLWFKRGDVVAQVDTTRRRVKAEKQVARDSGDRREMDRILAKIQSEGLGSLSGSEREFLNKRSRELRKERD